MSSDRHCVCAVQVQPYTYVSSDAWGGGVGVVIWRVDIQSFNKEASVELHLAVPAVRHIPPVARVTGYSGLE